MMSSRSLRAASTMAVVTVLFTTAGCAATSAFDRSGGNVEPAELEVAMPNGAAEIGAYADEVENRSEGSLTLDLLSRQDTEQLTGVLGEEVLQALIDGTVPLAILPVRDFAGLGVHDLDALIAPFVIDSMGLQSAVLSDADLVDAMLAGVEELGVTPIGILPGPLVYAHGITHPLLSAADFRGAVLAVSPGDVAMASLTALGAEPAGNEFNHESIDGYDGLVLQFPALTGNAYHERGGDHDQRRAVLAEAVGRGREQ